MGWDRVGDEISGGRGHAHMRWLCWWSTVRLYSFPLFRARFPLPPFLYPKYFNSLPHPIISLFFCLKGREQNTFGRVFVRPYSMVIFEIGLLFRARGGCCDIAPLPKAKSTPPGHIRGPLR